MNDIICELLLDSLRSRSYSRFRGETITAKSQPSPPRVLFLAAVQDGFIDLLDADKISN